MEISLKLPSHSVQMLKAYPRTFCCWHKKKFKVKREWDIKHDQK